MKIALNSDLGEAFGPWSMGDDATMLDIVTSANIAAGGHASDPETMFRTLSLAAGRGIVVGAHPGYADPAGFGRRVIPMSSSEIGRMLAAQVGTPQGVAALAGTEVRYVKPHGALGNLAADDRAVADAIVAAVRALPGGLAIPAISGTELELAVREAGVVVYSEIFADRAYLSTGRLVPRSRPDALLTDANEAAARLIGFLESGRMPVVDRQPIALEAASICVHSDTRGAVEIARQLRTRLEGAGVTIAPFLAIA